MLRCFHHRLPGRPRRARPMAKALPARHQQTMKPKAECPQRAFAAIVENMRQIVPVDEVDHLVVLAPRHANSNLHSGPQPRPDPRPRLGSVSKAALLADCQKPLTSLETMSPAPIWRCQCATLAPSKPRKQHARSLDVVVLRQQELFAISELPSLDCGAANRLQHLRCSVDDLRLHLTISSSASGARLTWLLEPCHHACFPRKHWMCTFCTDIGSWESPGTACESREICLRRQLRTPGRPRPSRCCRSP